MARRQRITVSDVQGGAEIGLTCGDVECLRALWGTGGDSPVWNDVLLVASRFVTELGNSERVNDKELTYRWNHLLMAVGNFKRQGGTMIEPISIGPDPVVANAPLEFTIPGIGKAIRADEKASACSGSSLGPTWIHVSEIQGLGVPTASTLMSALWPGKHSNS